MKFMDKIRSAFLMLFLLGALVMSCSVNAVESSVDAVVYRLYKDFGWTAIFDGTVIEEEERLGKPIAWQTFNVLNRYFTPELSKLILKEARCRISKRGELCNLEFDLMFASQDPAATDLLITAIGKQSMGSDSIDF